MAYFLDPVFLSSELGLDDVAKKRAQPRGIGKAPAGENVLQFLFDFCSVNAINDDALALVSGTVA